MDRVEEEKCLVFETRLLRKTIKDLKHFLETELEYTEEIISDLENDEWDTINDNIEYLIRDLVPEYRNQQDAVDTLVEKLKEFQEQQEKIIEGEN
jgi:tyrosine-protein phosphatase YwqE